MKKILLIFIISIFSFLLYSVDYTWTDASADGLWNNEANWDDGDGFTPGDGYPDDNNDTATINIASAINMNIGAGVTIGECTINNAGATLTQNGNLTIDDAGTENGNLNVLAGSLNMNGNALDVDGNIDCSGSIDASSGGNINLEGNLSLPAGGVLNLTNRTMNVGGNWSNTGGTFTETGSTVIFDLAGTNSVSAETFNNVEVSAGTIRPTALFNVDGTLTVNGGTLDLDTNNQNADIEGNIAISAGILNATNQTINAGGGWNNTVGAAAFTETGSTIIFDSGTTPVNVSAETWNNLTISKSAGGNIVNATGNWDVDGPITLTTGTFNPGNNIHTIANSWDDSTITFQAGSGTIVFDTNSLNINSGAANYFFNFEINVGGGNTATLNSNIDVDGTLTITSGTLDGTARTIDVGGNWSNTGGAFTETGSTVIFDVANINTVTAETFNDVQVSAGTIRPTALFDVNGNLTVNGGTLDMDTNNQDIDLDGDLSLSAGTLNLTNQTMNIGGSWSNTGGAFTETGSTVIFDVANINTVTAETFNDVQVSAGTIRPTALFDVNGNLTVNGGTLDMDTNNQDIDLDGDLSLSAGTLNLTNQTMNIGGSWSNTGGALTEAGSTVIFDVANINTVSAETFNDVQVSAGTIRPTALFDVNGNLTVNGGTLDMDTNGQNIDLQGDLLLSAGTLDIDDQTMNIAGSWSNTGGTLSSTGTGEVIFDEGGNVTSTAESSFNNVTISKSAAGNTVTMNGNWTLAGDLDLTLGTLVASGGGGRTLNIAGDWLNNFGNESAFTETNSTVNFTGNGVINFVEVFNNVQVSGGTRQPQALLDVNGNLTVNGGTLDMDTNNQDIDLDGDLSLSAGTLNLTNQTMNIGGSWSNTGGAFTETGSTVIFDVANINTVTAETFNDVQVLAGTIRPTALFDVNGNLTVNGGILDMDTNNQDIDLDGDLLLSAGTLNLTNQTMNIGGSWSNTGGALTEAGSTVIFDVANINTVSAETFNDVQVSAGTIRPTALFDVNGNLTVNGGTLDMDTNNQDIDLDGDLSLSAGTLNLTNQTMNIGGSWSNTGGALTEAGSTVIFDVANINTVTAETFNDVQVSAGTIRPTALFDVNGNLIVNGGTLDMDTNNQDIDLEGDFNHSSGTLDLDNQTMNIAGNWNNTGGTFSSSNTIIYFDAAAGTQTLRSGTQSFYDLEVTNAAGRTVQLLDNLTINNDMTFSNGTMDLNGGLDINIINDLLVYGGIFTDTNGGAGMQATTTISVGNNFTADGSIAVTNFIGRGGGRWLLNVSGRARVYNNGNNISANDSDASGGNPIAAAYAEWATYPPNFILNCINWDIDRPVITTRRTIDSNRDGFIDRIEIIVDQNIDDNFVGFSVDVQTNPPYSFASFNTGASANDDRFYIFINNTNGDPNYDTDALPTTQFSVDATWWDNLSDPAGNPMFHSGELPLPVVACTDFANPVLVVVEIGIDDPAGYDTSPYYSDLDGSITDPGPAPNFDMHSANAPPDDGTTLGSGPASIPSFPKVRTYHNTLKVIFSEPIDVNALLGHPVDPQSNYDFNIAQKSDTSFGNFEINGANLDIKGLGSILNCDLNIDQDLNFVQFENKKTLYIHMVGWWDGSNFTGNILSYSSVPTIALGGTFTTIANGSIQEDVGSLTLVANGSNINIIFSKDWDLFSPIFRYIQGPPINPTYKGDPSGGGSDMSCGVTSGTPLIERIEFAMSEAILDEPPAQNYSALFSLRYYDDAANPSNTAFDTEVFKFGDHINDYDGTAQSDDNPNDQGFSIAFDTVVGRGTNTRIAWTYTGGVGSAYITDLRGNRLGNIAPEKISLENTPPYIKDTRAVPGTDEMYVEFNEFITDFEGNDIDQTDFIYDSSVSGSGISILNVTALDLARTKYIFTLSGNLTEEYIVRDKIFASSPTRIIDSLTNYVDNTVRYPVSSIGINFFKNVILEDFVHKGKDWRITNFDGSKEVNTENMRVKAYVNVPKFTGLTPVLYYDVIRPHSRSKFWLPSSNSKARMTAGIDKGSNNWEFLLPSSDSEMKSGNKLSFVFKIGDYYCYRAPRSINDPKFSPKDAETYMVDLKSIIFQNNNVTILNNVINPRKSEITKLIYILNKSGPVSIVVYDLKGDIVKVLKNGTDSSGRHVLSWNGKNENGKIVTRGVYFIRVRAPGIFNQIRKVLVIK